MRESRLWLLSLAATGLIVILLGAHFALMHYSPVFYGDSVEATRSFEAMLARGRDALQMVLYVLFLAAALYHGLFGLRGVLLELPAARGRALVVNWGLAAVGLLFFAYGTYVTVWTWTAGRALP
jgi:succinate dehydrogenase hydrophobic anchor subunit